MLSYPFRFNTSLYTVYSLYLVVYFLNMWSWKSLLPLAILSTPSLARKLYNPSDVNIVRLDWALYEGHVINSTQVWVLEWFTQTCPACNMVSRIAKDAAIQLKDDAGNFELFDSIGAQLFRLPWGLSSLTCP